jgi:hypothetical protein
MATNATLGSDFSCVDDIDANLTVVSGARCLGEAAARRIGTPRGGLFYDKDYGYDMRNQLHRVPLPRNAAAQGEAEVLKDERVRDVRMAVEWIPSNEARSDQVPDSLSIELHLQTALGPFDYTLDIDDLTGAVLTEVD